MAIFINYQIAFCSFWQFSIDYYRSPALRLLGSILSGFIEVFVTPEKVQNFLPKNKVLAILFGTLIGFISLLVSVGLFQLSRAF